MKAGMVLKNAKVYTMDGSGTVADGVAVTDGRIVYVGTSAGTAAWIGPDTEVLDLEGKVILPGMIDTHIHPPGTADVDLFSISLFSVMNDFDGLTREIDSFIRSHPERDRYFGYGFSTGAFSGEEIARGPKKEHLDALCPDKPVFLESFDGHIGWVNSAALKAMGITRYTPDPEGGRIERHPQTGEIWGTLKEAALNLMPKPEYSLRQRIEAMRLFQKRMHSYGYTGIWNMSGRENLEELSALEKAGELKLRIRSAVELDPAGDVTAEFERLEALKQRYSSDLNRVSAAKFFADGVVEGVTAFLLEPYEEAAGKGPGYYGEFLWDDGKLKESFLQAHRRGFQIHVHSIGDGATRRVLDALAYAKSVVDGDFRPVITHNQLVSKEDIPRFAELGVIAGIQAGFWGFKEPDHWHEVDYPLLGKRAEHEYPVKSFFDAGVVVVSSSDHWVTPIPNPLWAIETGVTRNLNNPGYYGVEDITDMDDPTWLLNPAERTTVENMVRSYTSAGAYAIFLEDEIGSIEKGKYADLAVLGDDIFAINPIRIDSVAVEMTIFNGEIVYRRD